VQPHPSRTSPAADRTKQLGRPHQVRQAPPLLGLLQRGATTQRQDRHGGHRSEDLQLELVQPLDQSDAHAFGGLDAELGGLSQVAARKRSKDVGVVGRQGLHLQLGGRLQLGAESGLEREGEFQPTTVQGVAECSRHKHGAAQVLRYPYFLQGLGCRPYGAHGST